MSEGGMETKRITRFLQLMIEKGASDMHFSVGRPPMFRLSGEIDPLRYRVLSNRDYVDLIRPIVEKEEDWEHFLTTGDLDFFFAVPNLARFRANLFMQEGGFGAVFRVIPTKILTLDQLAMPPAVKKICDMRNGLVLVTGPTGSGKSTTLAAIIDKMNKTRKMHIITIEDPIEFVHKHQQSVITQREIGTHAPNFNSALKAAVREDPDLLLVGEMRDLETITQALNAAAAGLLVFGTLHTNSAAKTVDRIVNVFPQEEQEAVRSILAESLKGVLSQQLLKRIGGGRAAAVEIMFSGAALPNLIREGKTYQLTDYIARGKKAGMLTMDDALAKLVNEKVVPYQPALEKAIDKLEFPAKIDAEIFAEAKQAAAAGAA